MEPKFAFLARYAEPATDGTAHIFGMDFGRLSVESVPYLLTSLAVVVKSKPFPPTQLRTKFQIVGPDGVVVARSGDEGLVIEPGKIADSAAAPGVLLILVIPIVGLPIYGRYEVQLKFDTGVEVNLPFEVVNARPRKADAS